MTPRLARMVAYLQAHDSVTTIAKADDEAIWATTRVWYPDGTAVSVTDRIPASWEGVRDWLGY